MYCCIFIQYPKGALDGFGCGSFFGLFAVTARGTSDPRPFEGAFGRCRVAKQRRSLVDNGSKWRHDGAMKLTPKSSTAGTVDRQSLRLPHDMFEAIDSARARRIGSVSRNTWITEAIQEKLNREYPDNKNDTGA